MAKRAIERKEIVLINPLTRGVRLVDVEHSWVSFVVIIAIWKSALFCYAFPAFWIPSFFSTSIDENARNWMDRMDGTK